MKALILKEFKLAMHPVCYVFVLFFPLMILIPSYPLAVGFIYILSAYPILFLGANKGQQSNDLLFTTLLPVRKKDIVLARIITVLIMQGTYILLMSLLLPFAYLIQKALLSIPGADIAKIQNPGLSLQSYILVLAIAIIGYAIADLIFFPIYYKKGRSIVLSTLLTILAFVIYICVFTIVLPYVPGCEFLNNLEIYVQIIILVVALIISFLLHLATYKIASKRLEKVDF